MTGPKHRYKFQFNSDPDSCIALAVMFRDGWEVESVTDGDGYSWFNLIKW